jgi:hypothetical protein
MPKIDIDYSNTIIYKITCNDVNNKEVYVGHTTNFVQRKYAHKQSCINEKSANYKCKLYEVIRNNGGWNNWKMEIINFFNCKNHYEARIKEQEFFVSLNATLNSIEPFPKPKPKPLIEEKKEPLTFYCDKCNIYCNTLNLLELHNLTKKHKKSNLNYPKKPLSFVCESCDFITCNKKDYNRHLKTIKHLTITNQSVSTPKAPNSLPQKPLFCNCGKKYKDNSGLWRHKKICKQNVVEIIQQNAVEIIQQNEDLEKESNNESNNNNSNSNTSKDELIQYLINENKEFKNLILEIVKKDTISNSNNINNINTNSHNKTFNLQFFLNETCKDAMNMSDFIDSMKLQLSDLESVGKLGFVDGISNIIIKKLEALDVDKRPVHCSDSKRETMYIKDQDKWEKDDSELKRMKDLVRTVRDKNITLIAT